MATQADLCPGSGGLGKAATTGLTCPVCVGTGRVPAGGGASGVPYAETMRVAARKGEE